MKFDKDLEKYIEEINGIVFASEENQPKKYVKKMATVADKYWRKLDNIVQFMLPDIKEFYGNIDIETMKKKLGKPTIDYENCTVDYLEQSFDDIHIFSFEFDNDFENLQYFSIDG